ncbi:MULTISPECIES: 5'-nucleotidase C-terminal domain-containing protein [unclassified Actinomyces]|uniref:5'-nucleotidase C-terminal domain-containing protein n=1 Tax=unclassified Actinomyces TaxID=2609248 RepID=UPI000D5A1F25|nr:MULTISPECIES: 5'-nucleotidase C-terminal domain-containing protein [unclassified Actinomyces]RAX23727.1 bifunctional metallophosphatase/5'-nucleotidase [Actinomyces sp. Z3]
MPHLYRRLVAFTAALALGAFAPTITAPATAAEAADTTTLSILGITDLHGHIETTGDEPGAVTLACEVAAARERNPSTLFVSNGDNVGGSAYISSILDDQPTIDVLNAIGLDVTSAGNHEFDKGITDLADRLLPAFNAPILSANVTGNAALAAEGSGNGTWITEVDGVTVGFIGVVTEELPSLVSKSALEGLTVLDATATANARATALKDGDAANGEADVVVVLAHEDAAIYGNQFNGAVDAVVAGHTHVPFADVVKSTDGTDIAVVQPDHYGLKLGEISLTVTTAADGTKDVTAATARNLDLAESDCTTDAYGVADIVAKAKTDSEAAGNEVLTTLGSNFYRGTDTGTDYGANRSTESTASNLIATSFASWLAEDIQPSSDYAIGLMNPGGVRADYLAGELTAGEAYTVQPFGNEMAYATYTGAQVKQVLAEQFQPTTTRAALMLGTSDNVEVYLDQDAADQLEDYFTQISTAASEAERSALVESLADDIADARSRVIDAVYIDGELLDDAATVTVASNTFLLAGGDNFTTLGEKTMINTGILDRTVTSEYLVRISPATASYDKHQVGTSLAVDGDTVTARFTGLSYSATAEQGVRDAATSIAATVDMADGTTRTLTTSDIDQSVTPGLPETGQATLTFTLPDGVATQDCTVDGVSTTCAIVSFTITRADESTETLAVTAQVVHAVSPETPAPPTPSAAVGPATGAPTTAGVVPVVAGTPATGHGSRGALARTGAPIALGLLALGLMGGGTLLTARRRD